LPTDSAAFSVFARSREDFLTGSSKKLGHKDKIFCPVGKVKKSHNAAEGKNTFKKFEGFC
jgi:hypothetical protein